jgi:hypothetical protein
MFVPTSTVPDSYKVTLFPGLKGKCAWVLVQQKDAKDIFGMYVMYGAG